MMQKFYNANFLRKALIPLTPNCNYEALLSAAHLIVGENPIMLRGLVGVPGNQSLSTGALYARQLRKTLHLLAAKEQIEKRERVFVSHDPWDEFQETIEEENPDILILEWPITFDDLQIMPDEALIRPPCDIALVHGPISAQPQNILVALHESSYAEYALRVSLSMARNTQASLSALHLTTLAAETDENRKYHGLSRVIANIPDVQLIEQPAENPAEKIIAEADKFDLVVLGATALPPVRPLGLLTERILQNTPCGVIAVKPSRHPSLDSEMYGENAISILVDKWFAENTYHADEFNDLEYLLELKEEQNLTISLALPALNEDTTVGNVIKTIKSALVEDVPLLDEIVLMDSNSTDRTREIAESLGIPVYIHQQVLPQYGARPGKGVALWKSLYVTKGDIIVWVDTDIVNIHPRFVYGLLGPLLFNPSIKFIKGFYRRPLRVGEKIQAGGGGRVTELTARPLLNLFYPELSGVVQPLSGEYGGRRAALERLSFYSGYGVETGLLIDMFEKFGLNAIAQVDLRERVHHNQPLESLSKMSFAIIQVFIRKLEGRLGQGLLEEMNKSMKLIRYEPGRLFLEVEKIAERERPPIIEIPEYQERHGQ